MLSSTFFLPAFFSALLRKQNSVEEIAGIENKISSVFECFAMLVDDDF